MTTPPIGTPAENIVLLVDDQIIVAEAVRRLFAHEPDIAFHYCAKPQEAVERATALHPTVILQDLVMPEVDGLELVRQYRANPATAETPIIVLSTKEDPVTKSRAFGGGANDYLVKLPDRIELLARIRYHSKAYRALTALREQATRDGLTGLWNRRTIFEMLGKELARSERLKAPVGIIMADMDRFKSINDTYGHLVGDTVLQHAARVLSQGVRDYDHVGRYGGEEFLIVLSGCNGEQARALCERLRKAVEAGRIPIGEETLGVTSSFGIAWTATPKASELMALVRAADEALYRAKQNGRNCVHVGETVSGIVLSQ